MDKYIKLSAVERIGGDGEFLEQLKLLELSDVWLTFRDGFLRPGTVRKQETNEALGRLFCQQNAIVVLTEDEVLISKIPKRSGYVARYQELQTVFEQKGLAVVWDQFFIGSTYCLLDEQGSREQMNCGIYWQDVERFFEQQQVNLQPLRSSNLDADTFLQQVTANVSLSGLKVSDELLELASLVANGVLSQEEAMRRLGIH